MSSALVSVVIPVYQGATYVADSIHSVLAQTWSPIEVVVVDDGSTDDTVARVEAITDPRVRLVKLTNGGAARARNAGLAASRGEFVQFLDHDDLIHPRKIEIQMTRLAELGTDCCACSTWFTFDHSVDDAVLRPQVVWRDGEPFEWLLSVRGGGGMMPTGAWLTPRSVIERAGPWNESLGRNPDDDGEFFSRVILASRRVLFCDKAWYYYRNGGVTNLRRSRSPQSVQSLLETQRIYERRFLEIEDSARTRSAAAFGYASFLEMIYPSFPTHCAEAFEALDRLDVRDYPSPGSPKFALLVRRLGLRRALQVRGLLRRWLGQPMLGKRLR